MRKARRGRKKLWLLGFVLLLVLIYSSLSVYKAIDYTTTPSQQVGTNTPADSGLAYISLTFPSAAGDNVMLRGWWIPKPGSRKAIIFAHGRNGNRATYLALAKPLWDAGYNLLLFDLRGHGQSDSAPCTWGIKEQYDIIGATAAVKDRGVPASGIGVIGWSVGATSALMALGSSPDIRAVVSDSAYATSNPLLAHNALYPGIVVGLRLLRGIDINGIAPLANGSIGDRRVMLIHGAADSQVPIANATQLSERGGGNVYDTWIVPGAGHVEAYNRQPAEYLRRVTAFFDAELH